MIKIEFNKRFNQNNHSLLYLLTYVNENSPSNSFLYNSESLDVYYESNLKYSFIIGRGKNEFTKDKEEEIHIKTIKFYLFTKFSNTTMMCILDRISL